MARPRKNHVLIDEMIKLQEEAVTKAKATYNAEVGKLKDLLAKRDEFKKKEMECHSLDPYPVPREKSAMFINEPWLIDRSLL